MKYVLWFLAVGLLGCSGDNAAGSRVFAPEDLTILGNLSILGEPSSAEEDPSSFIRISGGVDSQSGLALTGLAVSVRVLGENATELGASETRCRPAEIAPGGSCTFISSTVLDSVDFKTSQIVEITPKCDQGTGTLRSIPVVWPDS